MESNGCYQLPDSDFVVYSGHVPTFEVKGRDWFAKELLQEDLLFKSIFQDKPEGRNPDPTCVFLLGPKACGKSTFLKKHQKFLRSNLRLGKRHCRVDYEFLRHSHVGYKRLIQDGLKKGRIFNSASKILKQQFPRWKLKKALELVRNKYDIVVPDNGGKKIGQIVPELQEDYNVHLVIIFVSINTCLSRQCSRASTEGRSFKDIKYNLKKYGNLMTKMQSTMLKTTGNIVVVDNEEFKCEIKGVFTPQEVEKAFQCVKKLHLQHNGFSVDLFRNQIGIKQIEQQLPKKYRFFGRRIRTQDWKERKLRKLEPENKSNKRMRTRNYKVST